KALDQVSELARKDPGVDQVLTIAGVSALYNNASLASAGVAYVVLKPWSERAGLLTLFGRLSKAFDEIDARVITLPPPPIQGIGNAGGFTLMVEIRDGSSDFTKLQGITNAIIANAQSQSGLQRVSTSFRADSPQYRIDVDRVKAQVVQVSVDQVFSTLATYLGSTYVVQFNKFGRVFQVYAQADAKFRLRTQDIANLTVRNQKGDMIPLGTLAAIVPTAGPALVTLYNLYPSSSIIGLPAAGFSSGDAIRLMEQNASHTVPTGAGTDWTAMSYQEKIVGNQMYLVFILAMVLVYLVLAGQYESWYAPISIIFSVPLALVGPVSVLNGLRIDNNLYTKIG
ncbi:MAG: efflux RND transporter permease subunit, partial [Bradyrhizobium sp.]